MSTTDGAISSSTTVLKTAPPHPLPTSKPAAADPLTPDQQTKYDILLGRVRAWTEVPAKDELSGPLTDSERLWLTRECLLRYLRAVKWHEKEAEKRLLETLTWRREYGVEGLTADAISPENETGKQIVLGYDKEARPCLYMSPGRQNTDESPRQTHHVVYMAERVIELMPAGQEKLNMLINFKAGKKRTNTSPGMSKGREVLNILQTHYPERLGRALIINVPFVVWGFFKLITPFIDPLTREKLKFNEDMSQYVPKEQLWTEFNGDLNFDYEHAIYWPDLAKMCEQRRTERLKRWKEGGKQIGESELYLAGGAEHGIGASATQQEEEKTEKESAVVLEQETKPVETQA